MQELLIEKIRTDGGVQSRERTNEEYVGELAELLKAGRKLPPVEVYNDGREIWMADGFHRLLAHGRENRRTIRCNVHKGTKADAIWASCGANQDHGLRRTNADKRRAAKLALKARPELSDRAISEHTGIDHKTVAAERASLSRGGEIPHLEKRVGADGKAYSATRPRIRPPWEARPAQAPAPDVTPPPPAPRPSAQPSPAGRAVRLDAVGQPIPDHLLPLFDRAPEVQALLSQVSSVKGALKRAEKAGDALFGDCHFEAARAALQTAYDAIKATKPYVVCPWCHGEFSEGCGGCGHRGVLGEYRWVTTVPGAMKG